MPRTGINELQVTEIIDVIYSVKTDLTIMTVSPSIEKMLGYRPEELVGHKFMDLGILAPEYVPAFQSDLMRVLEGEYVSSPRYEFISKDGARKRVELTAAPLIHDDEVIGLIGVVRDMSGLAQREWYIQKELVHADKMISLGVLVSGVAHEINNPNNFIMLNTPILKEAWNDAIPILDQYYQRDRDFTIAGLPYNEIRQEIPHLLSGIEEGSRRIQRIVEDLRNYARLNGGEMNGPVNINDVIKSAITLLNNMIKRSTKNFQVCYGTKLPLLKGNRQKLEQIIINLIQNACQALTNKDQAIKVSSYYNEEKDAVVIEVADEGEGIDQEVIAQIMAPFFSTKQPGEGTGLGLAVSEKIVRDHGGEILVSSKKGEGSVFRVVLPTEASKKRVKVLIADDEEAFRDSMREALEACGGFRVETVSNGVEACVKIGQDPPDLLVLDIMMPGMDGVEVCKLIKDRSELSQIKVLIVTGYADSSKVEELRDMGFGHIVVKPFKLSNFLEEIRNLMER